MKKIEDLFFTVTKIRKFEQMHFFYQLLENEMWYTYGILLSVEQLTLFCVEQMTFLKKVSISRDSSRCISSSWPWLILLNNVPSKLAGRSFELSWNLFPKYRPNLSSFTLYSKECNSKGEETSFLKERWSKKRPILIIKKYISVKCESNRFLHSCVSRGWHRPFKKFD